jgi:hypothetical protein
VTDHPATPEARADGGAAEAATAEHQAAAWVPQPPSEDAWGQQAPERPELAIGAAFAGGLLAALILKRLAR